MRTPERWLPFETVFRSSETLFEYRIRLIGGLRITAFKNRLAA